MVYIGDMSATWTEPRTDKPHPFLNDENKPESELPKIPEGTEWLALGERSNGWKDQRWKALDRDNWTCQECGKDLNRGIAEVHHHRPHAGYEDPEGANRLDNLESLCVDCHQEVESKRSHAVRTSYGEPMYGEICTHGSGRRRGETALSNQGNPVIVVLSHN